MAQFSSRATIIKRSKGRSSVAAAAYRSAEKMTDERTGIVHDYSKKKDVIYKEIMLPENAPVEYKDRTKLWNAVEKKENRKDAQTAREIRLSLPIELSKFENIKLAKEFVKDNFVDNGMCADVCIHDKNNGNPHVHILLTMRNVNETGFLNKNRNWNDDKLYNDWLQSWEDKTNLYLERNNINQRIDRRSYKEQGINKIPTLHLGVSAHAMEQRGIRTERGDINRAIEIRNLEIEKIESKIIYFQELKNEIEKSKEQIPQTGLKEIKVSYAKVFFKINELNNELEPLKNKLKENTNLIRGLESMEIYEKAIAENECSLNSLLKERESTKGLFKSKKLKYIDNGIQHYQNVIKDMTEKKETLNIDQKELIEVKDNIVLLEKQGNSLKIELSNLEIDYKYTALKNKIKGINEPNTILHSKDIHKNIELKKQESLLSRTTNKDLDKILEKYPEDEDLKKIKSELDKKRIERLEIKKDLHRVSEWDMER